MSQQERITLAQSVNLAKDLAIAQKGNNVTVNDVVKLVEEVYTKLFKEECNRIALGNRQQNGIEELVNIFNNSNDIVATRNEYKNQLNSLSKEDRDLFESKLNINNKQNII